jgi:small subunit ribosomal protein S17
MKIISGKVVATNLPKTAKVEVEKMVIHPLYKKRFIRMKVYHVQDEIGVAVGDKVKFVASKPFSKLKKWKITEVVGRKAK